MLKAQKMFLLMLACGMRELPPHLQVGAVQAPKEVPTPSTLDEAVAILIQRDPLVRRPPTQSARRWPALAPELSAYLDTVELTPEDPAAFQALEQAHPGTVATPLSRGWRLAAVEPIASSLPGSLASQRQAGLWLMPLRNSGVQPEDRGPWSWLPLSEVLAYGEAWILRGWLSHPDIPRTAAAEAIRDPAYGRLALLPEGRLILSSDQASPLSLSQLNQVVTLFLQGMAADRDSEQAKYRAALERLDNSGEIGARPLLALSMQVQSNLSDQGGRSAKGGSLLALQVARWLDSGLSPGLDRAQGVREVPAWDPTLGSLAALVEVAMLKDSADRLQIGVKRDRIAALTPGLADVLSGFGQGGLPLRWLERGRPEPATWLDLTRAAGAPDGTTAAEGLAAINGLLDQACTRTLSLDLTDEQRLLVERTQARATK
ncbi:MAG: hypothetical protein ACI9VR_004874 [Cognaticolwellia sp.]